MNTRALVLLSITLLGFRADGPSEPIAIDTFRFLPDTLVISAGTRIIWHNQDAATHTVTSGMPDQRDGAFHGVMEDIGSTFDLTLTRPGTYAYHCARHPFMRGVIHVTHPED